MAMQKVFFLGRLYKNNSMINHIETTQTNVSHALRQRNSV
jgi:hypothetical protein